MKTSVWLFSAAVSLSSLALAQTNTVVETTDPAKAAEIEQRAQQLAQGKSATAMTDQHAPVKKQAKRHSKAKAKHKAVVKEKAASDKTTAPEAKR